MQATQRFISDFCIVIDGTFNTNRLKLPLLVAVGQLNSGRTFPAAFSWCPEEDEASYGFFWQCLKDHCFNRPNEVPCAPPRVIIGDQSKGLTASIPRAFPQAKQQFCDWHAVEAMVVKMRQLGVPGDDIKATHKSACWRYIASKSIDELTENRRILGLTVGPQFTRYLAETWVPKEEKVIYLYTHKLANLGSTASQRVESYHDTVKELTNAQLSLEESVKRLIIKVNSIIKDIDQDEAFSAGSYSLLAQSAPFRLLRMSVSKFALKRLERQWATLDSQITTGYEVNLPPNDCECEDLLRFGIACAHYLKKAYIENLAIPKTMIHLRWWLNGPPIHSVNWRPFYALEQPIPSPIGNQIPSLIAQISVVRGLLGPEQRHQLDIQQGQAERWIENNSIFTLQSLLRQAESSYSLQQTPLYPPDTRREGRLARRGGHRPTNERALTANERAIQQERREQQTALQQERLRATQAVEQAVATEQAGTASKAQGLQERITTIETTAEVALESIPETPPRSIGLSLLIRTPERPRPRREASPEASPSALLPTSTAPPVLTRGKRRRQPTTKAVEARDQGFIH